MMTQALAKSRTYVRRLGPLHSLLRTSGILTLGRNLYEQRILNRGLLDARILGHRLRFSVTSRREISRIESFNEPEFVEQMLGLVRPDDVVWDIGANIGMISLLLAKVHGVTVHAFEPEPRNYEHLQNNIILNDFGNIITAHNLALGDQEGEIQLHVGGEVGEGSHSIVNAKFADGDSVPVPMKRAAAYSAEIESIPSVIKIDVEGAELAVLEGLRPLLETQQVRVVCVEIHPEHLKRLGRSAKEFADIMASYKYQEITSTCRATETHQVFTCAS